MNKAVVIVHDCDNIYNCYVCKSFEDADKKAKQLYMEECEKRGINPFEENGMWKYHCYYIGDWKIDVKDCVCI